MEEKACKPDPIECHSKLRSVHDTMDLLGGKWKMNIIFKLRFGKKRFMELQREVEGIASKMLSKELQELEVNGLIKRRAFNTKPITVEYELTEYGTSIWPIIREMADWGTQHRDRIINS